MVIKLLGFFLLLSDCYAVSVTAVIQFQGDYYIRRHTYFYYISTNLSIIFILTVYWSRVIPNRRQVNGFSFWNLTEIIKHYPAVPILQKKCETQHDTVARIQIVFKAQLRYLDAVYLLGELHLNSIMIIPLIYHDGLSIGNNVLAKYLTQNVVP